MEEKYQANNIETSQSGKSVQCLETSLKERKNEETMQSLAETQMSQENVEIQDSKEEIDLGDVPVSGKERFSESQPVPPPLSNIQIKIDSM